jgi:hypothetical protein
MKCPFGVNEVSFRARSHHNVHNTLGVDTRATGPRWRVDSVVWIQQLNGLYPLQYFLWTWHCQHALVSTLHIPSHAIRVQHV